MDGRADEPGTAPDRGRTWAQRRWDAATLPDRAMLARLRQVLRREASHEQVLDVVARRMLRDLDLDAPPGPGREAGDVRADVIVTLRREDFARHAES